MIKRMFLVLLFFLSPMPMAYSQTSFDTYIDKCSDLRVDIEDILQMEGLPIYFFYLALAESGCDVNNVSDKNARGLYQLIPATFTHYSIGVCDSEKPCSLDTMYDPLISTRVAAKYLKSLYERFDHNLDWTIAAYNAGGTNLKRKTGYVKGKDFIIVKSVFPQAYQLALKVRRFSKLDKN